MNNYYSLIPANSCQYLALKKLTKTCYTEIEHDK